MKILLIGLGGMGKNHLRVLSENSIVQTLYIFDVNSDVLNNYANSDPKMIAIHDLDTFINSEESNDIHEGSVTTVQEIVGSLVQETSLTVESPQQDLESTDFTESPRLIDGMRFNKWHVFGLICCAALLLVGGLLTFDIVRAIYSPREIRTASPILKVLR